MTTVETKPRWQVKLLNLKNLLTTIRYTIFKKTLSWSQLFAFTLLEFRRAVNLGRSKLTHNLGFHHVLATVHPVTFSKK